jgi:hypothetical protein
MVLPIRASKVLSAKVFDELFCQFDFEWYSRL